MAADVSIKDGVWNESVGCGAVSAATIVSSCARAVDIVPVVRREKTSGPDCRQRRKRERIETRGNPQASDQTCTCSLRLRQGDAEHLIETSGTAAINEIPRGKKTWALFARVLYTRVYNILYIYILYTGRARQLQRGFPSLPLPCSVRDKI